MSSDDPTADKIAPFVPKISAKTSISRYRPGVVPDYAVMQKKEIQKSSNLEKLIPAQRQQDFKPQSTRPTLDRRVQHQPQQSESEESDSEEDEEEEQAMVLLAPTFIPKEQRITHISANANANEALREVEQLQDRSYEARAAVRQQLKARPERASSEESQDSSSEDEELAYEKWKVREVKRIIRDRKESTTFHKQRIEEVLPDPETQETTTLSNSQPQNFMQKYYKLGPFFRDTDNPIMARDYNAPTQEDFDKSNLPGVLQKRKGDLGRKGQSKHTHLAAEDTTSFDKIYRM